ncbi:MAG: Fic family protein [Saprospiraceae bacterium]
MSNWSIDSIPSHPSLETRKILKALPSVHASLAELKGIAASIPDQSILINTLALREARDSSAIENIITTQDALFKTELNLKSFSDLSAKEVQNYNRALKIGFGLVKERGIITNNVIIQSQQELERNNAGFRRVPGTELKNSLTGKTIYTPPQDHDTIVKLMGDLQDYINDDEMNDYDPLVKMAIIHYQFESIHPFYDGNGRTGRIINILFLIMKGYLDLPILYYSSYIIRYKSDYYQLFQEVREKNEWENWILFMVTGLGETARQTISTIKSIRKEMQEMKIEMRDNYRFYSQDLLNTLFKHPYTKIEFVVNELQVSRMTASSYLNTLAKDGILRKDKIGNSNYYVNERLMTILGNN